MGARERSETQDRRSPDEAVEKRERKEEAEGGKKGKAHSYRRENISSFSRIHREYTERSKEAFRDSDGEDERERESECVCVFTEVEANERNRERKRGREEVRADPRDVVRGGM